MVGAVAKAFFVHLADHAEGAPGFLGLALGQGVELAGFGGGEEHGAGVFTRGDAGSAADALGGVHSGIGDFFADEDAVGIGGGTGADGDVAAGLLDAVKGGAIDDEVLDDREGAGAEGLDPDGVSRAELAHVELAGGGGFLRAVRGAIDGHGAGTADAFTAVVIKGYGLLTFLDEALVDDIHHLKEGGVVRDLRRFDVLKVAGLALVLTPDFEVEIEQGHKLF